MLRFLPFLSKSPNSFQIPIHSNFFRFFPNLPISLKFSQIPQVPPDSFKFLHFLSDSLLQILSIFLFFRIILDTFRCFRIVSDFLEFFQMRSKTPSGILKILSNFSVPLRSFQVLTAHFRSLQILSNPCRFLKIIPKSFSFFRFFSNFPNTYFEILQNSLRLSQAPSDSFQFFPNLPIPFRIPQILSDSDSLKFFRFFPNLPISLKLLS